MIALTYGFTHDRTRCSFQAAMLRLAGRVMVVDNPAASSAKKVCLDLYINRTTSSANDALDSVLE